MSRVIGMFSSVITGIIMVEIVLAMITHGNMYAVMASFGLLGFIALPSTLYRRKLKKGNIHPLSSSHLN